MLDPGRKLTIDGLPGVAVYADGRDPNRFYAFAAAPRLAADQDGRPQLSLLLYGRDRERPQGGQVTLTTSLALEPAEREALAAALAPAAVMAPEWLAGTVTARLVAGVECRGYPSLVGGNDCVLAAALDGSQAAALRRALDDGLPDSRVEYRVEVSAARHARHAASSTSETPTSVTALSIELGETVAERHVLELSGRLRIPPGRSADLITVVAF